MKRSRLQLPRGRGGDQENSETAQPAKRRAAPPHMGTTVQQWGSLTAPHADLPPTGTAAAMPQPAASARTSGTEDAEVALLQLALGSTALEGTAQPEVSLPPPAGQQPGQLLPGQHAADAVAQPRQPPAPPLSAPTTAAATSPGSAEEAAWLAAMQLSPLVDLKTLGPVLEAPGYGWPRGTPAPATVGATPAGLVRVSVGTPLSQAEGLPHPRFLDFGAPSVPPSHVALQHPAAGGRGPAAAAAAAAAPTPLEALHLKPQSVQIPQVIMTLPFAAARLNTVSYSQGPTAFKDTSSQLVPVLGPPKQVQHVPVPTAAAFAAQQQQPAKQLLQPPTQHLAVPLPPAAAPAPALQPLPPPEMLVVEVRHPAVPAHELLPAPAAAPTAPAAPATVTLAAVAAAAAAAAQAVPAGAPEDKQAPEGTSPRGSTPFLSTQSALSGDSSGGRWEARPQRQRRQRVQDSQFHWSDEEGEEEEGGGAAGGRKGSKGQRSPAGGFFTPGLAPGFTLSTDCQDSSASGGSTTGGSSAGSFNSSKPARRRPASGSSASRGGGGGASAPWGGGGGGANASRLQQQVQQDQLAKRVQSLLHLSAAEAAVALGCSTANFRSLCRSVGIQRWPSHRANSSSRSQ